MLKPLLFGSFFCLASLAATARQTGKITNKKASTATVAKKPVAATGKKSSTAVTKKSSSTAKRTGSTTPKKAVRKAPVKKSSTAKATGKKAPIRTKTSVARKAGKLAVEDIALDAFSQNKGRFAMPIEMGTIKNPFGLFKVGISEVVCDNPGLTLEGLHGSSVKSIYQGKVTDLFEIEGNFGIIVQHGTYFSVYSNLASVDVSLQQEITAGQVLGIAADNSEGNSELEFMIMKKNKNIDPEPWIAARK